MSEANKTEKKTVSWKFEPEIIAMLAAIADDEGESQITIMRGLIRKEFKRRKLALKK